MTSYALGTPVVAALGTTATGDLSRDGTPWPNTPALIVDKFGKHLMWIQQEGGGTKRHLPIVSNDDGATWIEPARTGFMDGDGEGFLKFGAACYDPVADLMHMVWTLTQSDGGVFYRQYSFTRGVGNAVTGVTRTRQLQLESGAGGEIYDAPFALWAADVGACLLGWGVETATRGEARVTMLVPVGGGADIVAANWKAPLNENAGLGAIDSLGSVIAVKYSCLFKHAVPKGPWTTLCRPVAGARALDLCWVAAYGAGLRFNRAAWSGADGDWRGGVLTAVTDGAGSLVSLIERAGTDAGYVFKHQVVSKLVSDAGGATLYVGCATWKDDTAGDTWTVWGIAPTTGIVVYTIDVYSAGAGATDVGRDIFVTGDVMFDTVSGTLVVTYTNLLNHDGLIRVYVDGVAVTAALAFDIVHPVDIPLLPTALVGGDVLVLYRDYNVEARLNPPTYTPPYVGYSAVVSLTATADPVVGGGDGDGAVGGAAGGVSGPRVVITSLRRGPRLWSWMTDDEKRRVREQYGAQIRG